MLYLVSGASASGKKTLARAVAEGLPGLTAHHDNEKPSRTRTERLQNLARWIDDALELEREGVDLVLATQSPLGELLASPRAIELEGIAPCLLDCHDYVRRQRISDRGIDPDWPMGMDTFCWAVFHRMHAYDPRWEQGVCVDHEHRPSDWSRWTDWEKHDPRWSVFIHDNTDASLEASTRAMCDWIERIRTEGAPLTRGREWWRRDGGPS
jgi:hypothetical protein